MPLFDKNKGKQSLRRPQPPREVINFSNVGGLKDHLKTLREVIILPLLHGDVFSHFKIKPPKGVLFHGPPGTGKTLVAAALVSELNVEGLGRVSFFPRKGADILDKWVGQSEKNLKSLFEKATKCRPSIIFFDELDGLAPIRSDKNDHIHSSIVATLLSLIDGLDSKPGVIVIGATNRIEALDPALRRKGRFDKELYFPLPGTKARKEILLVHTNNWKHRPSNDFLSELANITAGFCGADLQALCTEAVLACLRRVYPKVDCRGFKTKIKTELLKVEESDFLNAKLNMVPSSFKQRAITRNLSHIVKPLLIRQHERIIKYINSLWPHFLQEDYRFTYEEQRYAGRILFVGSNLQGLNTHLIPSVLKKVEHIPIYVYDTRLINTDTFNLANIQTQLPRIIMLSRIDEWWDNITEYERHNITSTLEEIHAGLPVLIMASCKTDVPDKLHDFFYNNSTILIKIENPNDSEREEFFSPLFLDKQNLSLSFVLEHSKESKRKTRTCRTGPVTTNPRGRRKKDKIEKECEKLGIDLSEIMSCSLNSVRPKLKREHSALYLATKSITTPSEFKRVKSNSNISLEITSEKDCAEDHTTTSCELLRNKQYFTRVLSDLLNQRNLAEINCREEGINKIMKMEPLRKIDGPSLRNYNEGAYTDKIHALWKRASTVTSKNMAVSQLELLYDVIAACIGIYQHSIDNLIENLENVFRQIENSYQI